MARLRPYPVSAFCAITLAIWLNRIWLAWTNPEDTVAEKLLWSLPITLFVLASAVLLVAILRGADPGAAWFRRTVVAFALGTIVFWAVRGPMILLHDHPVPFKVVHAVLAIVSWAGAAWALRWVSSPASEADGGSASGLAHSGHAR